MRSRQLLGNLALNATQSRNQHWTASVPKLDHWCWPCYAIKITGAELELHVGEALERENQIGILGL